MKCLVIDDDEQIRRLLSLVLSSAGWSVASEADGESGLRAAVGGRPDVILLDLAMPGLAGAEVLKRLRSWSSVPVVVVSVHDAEQDISALLDAGADDYVTKPFHAAVLVSRVKAVCRRAAPEKGSVLRSGSLLMDFDAQRVLSGDVEIRLTPTEFAILELLARHAGKIVTRSRILREIWGPHGELEEGSLRVHVASLRKKLEPNPSTPILIVTEPGIGYRLSAETESEGDAPVPSGTPD